MVVSARLPDESRQPSLNAFKRLLFVACFASLICETGCCCLSGGSIRGIGGRGVNSLDIVL